MRHNYRNYVRIPTSVGILIVLGMRGSASCPKNDVAAIVIALRAPSCGARLLTDLDLTPSRVCLRSQRNVFQEILSLDFGRSRQVTNDHVSCVDGARVGENEMQYGFEMARVWLGLRPIATT